MRQTAKPHIKVRAAMVMAGKTQSDVARAIGVTASTLSQKMNGRRDFTLDECLRIAGELGKTLDEIFLS